MRVRGQRVGEVFSIHIYGCSQQRWEWGEGERREGGGAAMKSTLDPRRVSSFFAMWLI